MSRHAVELATVDVTSVKAEVVENDRRTEVANKLADALLNKKTHRSKRPGQQCLYRQMSREDLIEAALAAYDIGVGDTQAKQPVVVSILGNGRCRLTSGDREIAGEDLGAELARLGPGVPVSFARVVPPELKAPCPVAPSSRAYATAHADKTNHCAARAFGCKFTVRGNSVGRHEQGCPLHLATVLLEHHGSKIESFDDFFKAVESVRGKGKVGSPAGFMSKINKKYGSYAKLLKMAKAAQRGVT